MSEMASQDNNEVNILAEMFDMQTHLTRVCGAFDLPLMDALQEMVSAASVEANEALAPFIVKTKPWKMGKEIDLDHVDEEMVDIFFFIMEYWILRGKSWQSFADQYMEKHVTNLLRIQEKINDVARMQNPD